MSFRRLLIGLSCWTVVLALSVDAAMGGLGWGTGGNGGTGTWDTTTSNWWSGSGNVPWTGGGDAVFSGSSGKVTITGTTTIYANSLTFGTKRLPSHRWHNWAFRDRVHD